MRSSCARAWAALLAMVAWAALLCASTPARAQVSGPIYTVELRGTITGATTEYLRRALQTAESANASALIILLGSQGGVLRDVRPFAGSLAEATVPVVVFVAPSGTQSGPTGALLLSAAHLSAMAPNTSFGSPLPLSRFDAALSEQTQVMLLDSVVDQLRDWNSTRGRSTVWIDQAVRDGLILTNEQAVALNPPAVDLIAADLGQLLTLLDGRSVALDNSTTATLTTLGRTNVAVEPTLWEGLRMALAEPTLAFALLIFGALLVYLEFAAPGTAIFAGSGIVLILGALVGLFALPVQPWAMLLLFVALALLGAEFFVSVHGALAVIGLVLMIVSGLNLIDPAQAPGTSIALWAILGIAALLGAAVAAVTLMAVRVRRRPVTTGQEGLIGRIAEVRQALDPEGMVYVDGALWQAICEDGEAERGERVRVTAVHNLQLIVRKIEI
ncbi:MAG: nodulation protein NfeD [Roseiflexaceae bacterium]|nr:nodulation protein NfeD [Roseiflexaceae bacterium]